jgi:hypothetical protein
MSVLIIWVVASCGCVGRYRLNGGTYYFHLHGSRWKLSHSALFLYFLLNYGNLLMFKIIAEYPHADMRLDISITYVSKELPNM